MSKVSVFFPPTNLTNGTASFNYIVFFWKIIFLQIKKIPLRDGILLVFKFQLLYLYSSVLGTPTISNFKSKSWFNDGRTIGIGKINSMASFAQST